MTDWIGKIEANEEVLRPAPEPAGGAAVLIPLLRGGDGETRILFEQRALDLDVQPAEICFPGGGIEPGETPAETACREAEEELLISREQIRILGETEGVVTNGGLYRIRAFVGELSGYEGTFFPGEVDHVFTVPLEWFRAHEPEQYMTTQITVPDEDFPFELIPGGRSYPWRSGRTPVWFYRHPDGVIWGLTARILVTFLRKLG